MLPLLLRFRAHAAWVVAIRIFRILKIGAADGGGEDGFGDVELHLLRQRAEVTAGGEYRKAVHRGPSSKRVDGKVRVIRCAIGVYRVLGQ